MLTAEQLKQLSHDVEALYKGVRGWEDACYFHIQTHAAGALAAETQYFNVVKAYGVSNMERANEFIYPFIVTEIGVQMFGLVADERVVFDEAELMIEKDQRKYPAFPVASLPGGGGMAMAYSDLTALAALVTYGTNGLGNSMWVLPAPIAFVPNQVFRGWIRSSAVTALGADTEIMVMLKGLVARTVI